MIEPPNFPDADEAGRQLPYDVDIEQALLGALLVDAALFERIASLKPEHFYDPLHVRLWGAMLAMNARGEAVTPLTLKAMMERDAGFAEVKGLDYLVSMARAAPAIPNVKDYARILIDLATRRELIRIGENIIDAALTAPIDLSAAVQIEEASKALDLMRQPVEGDGGSCFTLSDWLARDIPTPDLLLGEILSTTTRMMIVAPTGLGKTNFTMMMGMSVSAGRDFMHWTVPRPHRVLFVDGEMSRRLMKIRLADAARRLGVVPANFFVLCRDDLADMPPLNTKAGQDFIDRKIKEFGGVDLIILDSVMSLLTGDMKDEESWEQTLPWIKRLTKRSIGQLWVHHTGINETRSYGTSTREWQLDTVALLELLERPGIDIAFNMKFTKARLRAPYNRADFEPAVITLSQDQWASETAEGVPPPKFRKMPSPKALAFHGALIGALCDAGKPRPESYNRPSVTIEEWVAECGRRGLVDPTSPANRQRALMSKYRLELVAAKWVVCNGNIIENRTVAK
jgi:hypothetical protein